MEAVARALSYDQNMSRLTADSVFFIPEGDIHYYYALGYLGKGDGAAAKREWESFLVKLSDNQWAFRAREHLAQLGAAPAATGKGKRRHRPSAPGPAEGDSSAYDQSSARYRIQGYLYRIRLCYQKELKAKPQLAGQLRIGFTITKEGKVQDLKVVSSTVRKPSLHTCVMNTVKTIYFNRPSSNAAVKVTFPMEFKPVQ